MIIINDNKQLDNNNEFDDGGSEDDEENLEDEDEEDDDNSNDDTYRKRDFMRIFAELCDSVEPFFIRLRFTAQNIKVTRHKTRQRTTSRDKHTDKNDREASWEKDGSSSATYHRKEKAADCNRYIAPIIEGRDSSLCVVLLKNPFNFRNHFLLGYVPQHRTLKLQDTRQNREQHHETSTQTRMTERHHGKKMAPVAPPTIERRRQLIVTATNKIFNLNAFF
ncbi:hypothetical protein AVEN_37808-1 [Araneus ventricosus]|uniref:Uncharacterized protein n=1 Tax=Araneus ventricosus TaxID=182803 RepID=A0A4Y2G6X8_ARAVE|nr:hypothetical protein AVEN_37808-1 [Araneus ventricosus]